MLGYQANEYHSIYHILLSDKCCHNSEKSFFFIKSLKNLRSNLIIQKNSSLIVMVCVIKVFELDHRNEPFVR